MYWFTFIEFNQNNNYYYWKQTSQVQRKYSSHSQCLCPHRVWRDFSPKGKENTFCPVPPVRVRTLRHPSFLSAHRYSQSPTLAERVFPLRKVKGWKYQSAFVSHSRNIKPAEPTVCGKGSKQWLKQMYGVGDSQTGMHIGIPPESSTGCSTSSRRGEEGKKDSREVSWARPGGEQHYFHPHSVGQPQAHTTSECKGLRNWSTA